MSERLYDEAQTPLTERERAQLKRMFSDWWEVPGEWKTAMRSDLEKDPPILGKATLGGQSIAGLMSAWRAYDPTWTATTAPSLGNGTLTGRFCVAYKTVFAAITLVAGSTTTFGTGPWDFGLPVPTVPAWLDELVGSGYGLDSSAAEAQTALAVIRSTTHFRLGYQGVSPPRLLDFAHDAPFAWAVGDKLQATLTYEAA